MAFNVQNDDGTVEGANAYVEVATVRQYWTDRGLDLSTYTDTQMEAAIVQATDYLDARYKFVGWQIGRLQGTQWPRGGLRSSFLRGLPPALINAACALTHRALTKKLMPDPTVDPSGQAIAEVSKAVGPLSTTVKYASSNTVNPKATIPQFPEVTLMLQASGLISSTNSGSVVRG